MKAWKFALIGSVVLLVGVAAARGANERGRSPEAASALVGGSVSCFEEGGRANLNVAVFPGGGGGVIGIPGAGGGSLFATTPGTCADALAALGGVLPAPLCASETSSFGALQFACSGGQGDVVEAVGDLAKAVIALP